MLGYRRGVALFFSLAFVVHPALTQAVAWIPGRNDSLLALFVLAAFIPFLGFLRTGNVGMYLLHLLFFGLALFTKESALGIVPLAVLFMVSADRKRITFKNGGLLMAGWSVLFGLWFYLRRSALQNPIHMGAGQAAASLWRNLPAVIPMSGKIIFPFGLSVLPVLPDMSFAYGYATIALIAVALSASQGKAMPRVVFGLAWFLLFLLPSFIRPNPAILADFLEHRLYLPMVGMIIVLCEIDWLKSKLPSGKAAFDAAGLTLAALALIAFVHSRAFADRLSFWQSAAATSPHSPLAHRNLGAMYYLDGQLEPAEAEYRKALGLNPGEPMAHNNLGLIYVQQGRLKEAEAEYRQEMAVNPKYDNVFLNFGILCYKEGRFEEAAAFWKEAVAINPDIIDAHRDLAVLDRERRLVKGIGH
jgi:tetratricopeptide (TPR) repeat protein